MDIGRLPQKVSRRVGNWCEEAIFQQEKLNELLEKVEKGEAAFMKRDRRIQLANQACELSSVLEYGTPIMIQSIFTNGYVSAVPSQNYPDLLSLEKVEVVTSHSQDPREPKSRSCVVLERAYDPELDDRSVRYGEKFYLGIRLPGLDKPLYLASEPNTPTNQKWGPNTQIVYLSFERGTNALWKFEWADPDYRLEMELQPVQPKQVGVLVHVHTGCWLSASNEPQTQIPSDFGVEPGLMCYMHRNVGSRHNVSRNYFTFITKP